MRPRSVPSAAVAVNAAPAVGQCLLEPVEQRLRLEQVDAAVDEVDDRLELGLLLDLFLDEPLEELVARGGRRRPSPSPPSRRTARRPSFSDRSARSAASCADLNRVDTALTAGRSNSISLSVRKSMISGRVLGFLDGLIA